MNGGAPGSAECKAAYSSAGCVLGSGKSREECAAVSFVKELTSLVGEHTSKQASQETCRVK